MESNIETKKITLNFFGEEIEIKIPTSLKSLREVIADKFMFDPKDASELVLSYVRGLDKRILETEKDFQSFVLNHIPTLDIDISEYSKIYQNSLIQLQNEEEKDKKRLDELIKMKLQHKEKFEEKSKEFREKFKNIDKKIMELVSQKRQLKGDYRQFLKESRENSNQCKKEIIELQKKLNLPITEKIDEKKKFRHCHNFFNEFPKFCNQIFVNKNLKEKIGKIINVIKNEFDVNFNNKNQEEIHYHFRCDGCNCSPIKGIRYHCKECNDFDYCPSCYEKNKESHKHEFEIVKKSIYQKPPEFKKEDKKPFGSLGEKVCHFGIQCDGCKCFPIIGKRYKCMVCPDFDYCEKCEEKNRIEHNHPFIEINQPMRFPSFPPKFNFCNYYA